MYSYSHSWGGPTNADMSIYEYRSATREESKKYLLLQVSYYIYTDLENLREWVFVHLENIYR